MVVEAAPTQFVHGLASIEHPFSRVGISLGHRMTIVREEGGALHLHSPIPLTDELAARLEDLGPVKSILAPSLMHDLWLEPWARRYPNALRVGPRALDEKHPGFGITHALESDASTLAPTLRFLPLEGMPKVQEWVAVHEASRSLIVCDLIFDRPSGHRHAGWLLARLFGLTKGPCVSRLFRSLIKDRTAFLASLERVLAEPWDRVVLGHGAPLEDGARTLLRATFKLRDGG